MIAFLQGNALNNAESAYLRQHADNPVDWYPWGKRALERAKQEKKPIFLSIGYSTCHWCHVMEEESFEDKEVATLLNAHYVAIKVDKEELPQLDAHYQALYRNVTGKRGGWPLTLILTPKLQPLFVGTYLPKERGYGSKGLLYYLRLYAECYRHHNCPKLRIATESASETNKSISPKLLITQIASAYDHKYGGFGKRPKFPEATLLNLLFDMDCLGFQEAGKMLYATLNMMARSGLYDQVEGGFFRYTVDRAWQTPHFEKMLYDNAALIALYAKAARLTRRVLYRKVALQSLAFLQAHFKLANGLYGSASDADSDGEEGGYYLFAYDHVRTALLAAGLDAKQSEAILHYLSIEEDGNIDGELSHIHLQGKRPEGMAKAWKVLRTIRKARRFPFVDPKGVASYNAMLVSALCAAATLDRDNVQEAKRLFGRIVALLWPPKRGLKRYATGEHAAQVEGVLEDYAYLLRAALDLYELTLDAHYLHFAKQLSDAMLARFYHTSRWYSDVKHTIEAQIYDRHYTSAVSVAIGSLMRLQALRHDRRIERIVAHFLQHYHLGNLRDQPSLARLHLMRRYGIITISAPRSLWQNEEARYFQARYPYLLRRLSKENRYLACSKQRCFAATGDLASLLTRIEKEYADAENQRRSQGRTKRVFRPLR